MAPPEEVIESSEPMDSELLAELALEEAPDPAESPPQAVRAKGRVIAARAAAVRVVVMRNMSASRRRD